MNKWTGREVVFAMMAGILLVSIAIAFLVHLWQVNEIGDKVALAAQTNDTNRLLKLLRQRGNPNGVSYKMPALHWAILHSNQQAVQALLYAGADINTIDSFGCNALCLASTKRPNDKRTTFDSTIIRMLQKAGARKVICEG